MVPTPSGCGSKGSVSNVDRSYSTFSSCVHSRLWNMLGARKPTHPQFSMYSLIRFAFARKVFLERNRFPLCVSPWMPTSNPCFSTFFRNSSGTRYPSGTKLNDERNPYLFSISISLSHLPRPFADSTSCVSTKENIFPSGHPDQLTGDFPELLRMGQTDW